VTPWAVHWCCLHNFFVVLPEILSLLLGFSVKIFCFLINRVSHVLFPFTLIYTPVGKLFDTKAISLTVNEISIIGGLIWPSHRAFTLDIIFNKFTLILLARLSEVIFALTMELAINKITLVDISVKFKLSFASLLAVYEIAGVLNLVIFPLLSTLSVVHIVEPFTVVH